MNILIIIVIILIIFISEFITYKIIKRIDKKEREKLYNWELGYIKQLTEEKKLLKEVTKNSTNNSTTNSDNTSSTDVLESKTSSEDNMQAAK